ncbi:hypothetical protein Ptr902_10682 [Pyrenophora tritici-repentis]|nr:hypothetical protein Ptr902_10682 [Pyrenophora tritici-repentis]
MKVFIVTAQALDPQDKWDFEYAAPAEYAAVPIIRQNLGLVRTPYNKNKFEPEKETLDGGTNEEYCARAESDPYTHYILKTGKYKGKTIKQIHEQVSEKGNYLTWMLTNAKACKDLDEGHIVRRAIVHWDSEAKNTEPAVTPSKAPSARSGPAATSAAPGSPAARFRDSQGKKKWIDGMDIIGLFHMTESQLTRAGVKANPKKIEDDEDPFYPVNWRYKSYDLQKVYNAAVRSPNCPRDETLDQALERYLEKLRKCGRGKMRLLPAYCQCKDCDDITSGPTSAGSDFCRIMEEEYRADMRIQDEVNESLFAELDPCSD